MIKNEAILASIYMIEDYKNGVHFLDETVERVISELRLLDKELEALQPRSCEGCKYLYINKHSEFVEYCTDLNIEIPYSDITTFYCNRHKPKE